MATYADVLARLVSARRFGVVLGLDRMRALLDRLGTPDSRLGRVIHVAGTNGKGSTVAMLAHLARTAGLRVAAYTSPHLCELRERIAIDGAPIAYAAFVSAAEKVSAAGGDELTFFEQVTAIACVAIAFANVDLTILEVGLGGRLDATNAIGADIAVVTGVAMDHEAILGDTLEKIAIEKAGIFKREQRIVIGASGLAAAVPVLVEAARAVGVEPVIVDETRISEVPSVVLVGEHQRANAACALAALAELSAHVTERGSAPPKWARLVDLKVQTLALSTVQHPGRFEILRDVRMPSSSGKPARANQSGPHSLSRIGLVILDGAHNPHGAAQLARTLVARGIQPTLVLGVSADKNVSAIVRELLPAVGDVIATRYQQERALAPAELARIVASVSAEDHLASVVPVPGTPDVVIVTKSEITNEGDLVATVDNRRTCHVEPDLVHALRRASDLLAPVLVAGSLFLVGEARALLLGVVTDPIVATDPAPKRS
ncbi:MAG: bifunctional folylpolyglutamate synthase/dihydrofolate synthase [Kofleriaceae bacterium]